MDVNWRPIIFIIIYSALIIYFIILYFLKRCTGEKVKEFYNHKLNRVYVLSKSASWTWKYIAVKNKSIYIGIVRLGKVKQIKESKIGIAINKKVEAILIKNRSYRSFVNFSPIFKIDASQKGKNKVLYLKDLRYFDNKGKFFFYLNILYDNNNVVKTSLTWTKNKEKRMKKIYGG